MRSVAASGKARQRPIRKEIHTAHVALFLLLQLSVKTVFIGVSEYRALPRGGSTEGGP